MWRNVGFGLTHLEWSELSEFYEGYHEPFDGSFGSRFGGNSMAISTELSRQFFFGKQDRWLVRPYMALDLNGFWQRAASEDAAAYVDRLDRTGQHPGRYLALDYLRTNDVRLYWRPGLHWERSSPLGSVRGQAAYSFRAGGRGYANVRNQFQYGGDSFNMRGIDDGGGFATVNIGTSLFLDKKRTSLASFDYWVFSGRRATTQALQLGAQKHF